ncbi:hypothetical protein [Streptococcus suis]|uniref:CopG family transcriptional regulator n=1 Tax=Streptococcus suis TaxID=1307 RepID=A0A3R8M0J1_STRSU|nr:hypothetical protein [Streptococcus suis]MBY4965183.1 hypothetical protein [Streptococcus suis]MDW8777717.1 hypothetical protein [Streptococcus suis]RRN52510.1 hypothetical protein EI220_01400 [Streptococcus suis]RRR40300.1 hypothetical protein EJA00_11855 [Streptococcus suis]TII04193.1 hypothetical protein FAJ35_00080 [Streptococcus suis]
MAFEIKKDKISKALSETLPPAPKGNSRGRRAGRPSGKTKYPYQFTLKPQNREKLDRIAEQAGYSGASTFLDEWLENYEE